jgi:hypothetical protein
MAGMGKREKRRAEIRRLLERREREGLTYGQLAAASGIPKNTLAAWSSRFRRERATGDAPGFVELVEEEPRSASAFEVVLSEDRRLRVAPGFDEAELVRLVAALERC